MKSLQVPSPSSSSPWTEVVQKQRAPNGPLLWLAVCGWTLFALASSLLGQASGKGLGQTPAQEPTLESSEHRPDAWNQLEVARQSLEAAGAIEAGFEQGFQPAGFQTVDRESGRVSMRLPDCLRWDYFEPFPKVFLLCSGTAWSWNPGESAGLRQEVDSEAQPGLDLLLVDVEQLKTRYNATVSQQDGQRRVTLAPLVSGGPISAAVLSFHAADGRLVRIEYDDADGNQSSFDLTAFDPVQQSDRFQAPKLAWEEP